MVDCLKDEADRLGIRLNPKRIMIDFELGAIKGFKRAFPGADIKGCFFYITNTIYKHVCESGFKKAYAEDAELKILCLPFLQLDDIDNVWTEQLAE